MKILIINYFYPPIADAHAFRWEQIARHWGGHGHRVDVVTARVRGLPRHSTEEGVSMTRIGWLNRPNPDVGASLMHAGPPKSPSRIRKALRALYNGLYWPDSAWHWIPGVLLEAWRRRHIRYDLVVSYYPCFAAHFAGALMKRAAAPRALCWLVDYGDPFSVSTSMQPNNYRLYGRLNYAVENWVAKQADGIVLTNNETANAYKASFRRVDVTHVIPHLVDIEALYRSGGNRHATEDQAIHLTYVGGFHREVRRPDRLLDLMRRLNARGDHRFILKIFGPLNGFDPAELAPPDCHAVRYMGPVQRARALELIRNADFLVNVDNTSAIMTPSKIVEYIATGNRILNISNPESRYEPLRRYVERGFAISLKSPAITDSDAASAYTFLTSTSASPRAPRAIVEDILAQHSLASVADSYLEIGTRARRQAAA